MTIHLDAWLPMRLQLPTRTAGPRRACGRSVTRSDPRAVPIWHCSRWGLPCRSGYPSRGELLPRRFTLTPDHTKAVRGGLFSVALSLGLPRPGVTRHRCLVESGLSSTPATGRRGHPALRARSRLGGRGVAVNGEAPRKIDDHRAIRRRKRARGARTKARTKSAQDIFRRHVAVPPVAERRGMAQEGVH